MGPAYPDIEAKDTTGGGGKKNSKNSKLQTNILYEYRCKKSSIKC